MRVFHVDEVQASRDWRSRRSRWFYRPDDDPEVVVNFWVGHGGAVKLEVVDEHERVLRVLESEAETGLNTMTWDLLVDRSLALAAEQASLTAEAKSSEDQTDGGESADAEAAGLSKTPYAESVRLGHALYVLPGDYRLRVSLGETSEEATVKIEPPEELKPRVKEQLKLRGKK